MCSLPFRSEGIAIWFEICAFDAYFSYTECKLTHKRLNSNLYSLDSNHPYVIVVRIALHHCEAIKSEKMLIRWMKLTWKQPATMEITRRDHIITLVAIMSKQATTKWLGYQVHIQF